MINKKFSYNGQIVKSLTEFLSKIGIQFNVKPEPWLNVHFRRIGSGPYRWNLWIFIYVWDTGELVTNPIVIHNWLDMAGKDLAAGMILTEDDLKKIIDGGKRVKDSIKMPKRGVAKSVIYVSMGTGEDGHASGKIEIEPDKIENYKF